MIIVLLRMTAMKFFLNEKKRGTKNVLGNVVEDLIYKYSEGTMTFKYVETLDTFINKFNHDDRITYEMLQDFINCIVSQYYMLGDYNKTIYAANFDNILVFDNEFFIFMGNKKYI